MFFPTDLEYFINFERDDKENRDSATDGKPTRTTPKVSDYRLHQERTGAIPAGLQGGLYRRVFLGHYHPPTLDHSLYRPKTWHGEPMFAIRRAIALLGTAQIRLLPSDIQDQLRTLHQLYFIDDPQGYRDEYLSTINSLHGPTEDNDKDRHNARRSDPHGGPNSPSKRPGTDHQGNDGGNGPSPTKRQRGEFELTMRPGQFEEVLHQARDQYGGANGWILGPDSTTEDAVRKLSSIFSHA